MMLQLARSLMVSLVNFFREHIHLSKLQKENRYCKFYPGVVSNNTTFEGFNILFNDVVVSECSFGAHTYVQKKSTIFNSEIGKFCSIASNVSIGPGIHKIDSVSTHPCFYLKKTPLLKVFSNEDHFSTSAKIFIGHDVWIGERVIIMGGINIGTGAIIASGAVVTKDVEPFQIVGGVPARHIRYRFDKQTISFLQKSQWWNFPDKWFEENGALFLDVEKFKRQIQCSQQEL